MIPYPVLAGCTLMLVQSRLHHLWREVLGRADQLLEGALAALAGVEVDRAAEVGELHVAGLVRLAVGAQHLRGARRVEEALCYAVLCYGGTFSGLMSRCAMPSECR